MMIIIIFENKTLEGDQKEYPARFVIIPVEKNLLLALK